MMAKKYIKPELLFESFELSQQIAACDYKLVENTLDDAACTFSGTNKDFQVPMVIFLSGNMACDVQADSYCYHSSTGGFFSVFNS